MKALWQYTAKFSMVEAKMPEQTPSQYKLKNG